MKQLQILLMLVAFALTASAQRFPIRVIPTVNPPAPVNFYSYADGSTLNSPLRVQLLLGDLGISNRQIRLKVYFQGNGINFQGADNVVGATPLFIDGGVPLILNNATLAPYFELQNLRGISPRTYGQTIPEGSYQFCFEVYDVIRGIQLSAKTCATTFIFKNEPPILNLPLNKSNMVPRPVDNIVFQWSPRHINVSNVVYEFSLVEIWDNHVDPQTAFLSSPPVFQTTTRATSFVYGPGQPLLLGDKRYAWQVQAKALKGAEEIGLFKNEGKSEIFWFSKTEPCDTPTNVYGEPKGLSKMNIFWDEDPTVYTEYMIAYREKGRKNSRWFTKRTNAGWATIWDLKPNTTYEYKVRGKCTFQYSAYTRPKELTTAAAEGQNANYNCGIVPDAIAITNREGHPNLLIGDRITAGDFVITITDITSEDNGIISGSGFVRVPYFEMARFGVVFNNILINTDYQLAEGEIVTLYDPIFGENAEMVVDIPITEWLSSIGGLINDLREDIATALDNGDITEAQAEDMNTVLDAQEGIVSEVQVNNESSESLESEISKTQNEEDKTALEQEKEELDKENQSSVSAVKEAIANISDQLGGSGSAEGEVSEDNTGFFDGYLPITATANGITVQRPDDKGTFTIPINKKGSNTTFYQDYTVDIEGTTYNFVFTSNISSKDDITQARKRANSPPDQGIVIYYHYDTDQNRLGYKVEMAQNYFGSKITGEEFDWSRAAFKRGLKNMIRDLNAVDDWSVEILDMAHSLNTYRIKPLLAAAKMPEEMWNPDVSNYDKVPIHIEPLGAGITDGAIEEIAGIPQLVSLVIDYNTDQKVKEKIDKAWEELDSDKVVQYAKDFVENRSVLYDTGSHHQIEYQSGKDVTALALAATGISATVKTLKESTEYVKDLVSLVKKKVDDGGGGLIKGLKTKLNLPNAQWLKFEAKFKDNIDFLNKVSNNPSYVKAIQRIEEGGVDLISHQNYTRYVEKMARYQDEIIAGGDGVIKYYRVQTSHPLSKYMSIESGSLKFHKKTDLNISTTNRLHAEEYATKKLAKEPKGGFVEVIEFEVPKSIDLEMKKVAIPQDSYKKNLLNSELTAPKIVDPTAQGNPFELPLEWRNKIEMNYINGSAKIISKTIKN